MPTPANTIGLYDTGRMLNVLEQLPPAPTFLRNTFFSNVINHDTDTIAIDIVKGGRRVTPYIRPVQEGVVMDRGGHTTNAYKIPYIRVKRQSNADMYMSRTAGEGIFGTLTPAQRAAKELVDDFAELSANIDAEEERQAAELIFTAKVTIRNENGEAFENISFEHTNVDTLTGTAKFSDPSQNFNTVLEYLRKTRKSITVTGAPSPNHIAVAPDVGDVLIKIFNPADKNSMISSIRADRGQIDIRNLPDGITYIGYFAELGCDIYSYDGTYLDLDNVVKPYAPQGYLSMLSTNARFDRNYGAIKNYHGNFVSVSRFPHSWIENDGRGRMVQVESAPLLALHQVDALAIRKVM